MLLIFLIVPDLVAAQDGGGVVGPTTAEWQFWAVLAGAALLAFGLSVVVNRYLAYLENKLPPWAAGPAEALAPYAYQQADGYFDRQMARLRTRAAGTPEQWDDDLVEMVDVRGNRVLVQAARVFGHDPAQAETDEPGA
jgi:hypothetical protein